MCRDMREELVSASPTDRIIYLHSFIFRAGEPLRVNFVHGFSPMSSEPGLETFSGSCFSYQGLKRGWKGGSGATLHHVVIS